MEPARPDHGNRSLRHALGLIALTLVMSAPSHAQTLKSIEQNGDVVLSWDLPVPTQEILRASTPDGPFTVIGQSDTGTYRDVGAVPAPPNDSFYAYQIQELVQPIADLLLAVQSGVDVLLVWNPQAMPGMVEVQRATDPAGPFIAIGQTAVNVFQDANAVLDPTPLFVYRVRAIIGPPVASNYAFRIHREVEPGPAVDFSSMNPLAPPYYFFPDGDVGNRNQTAESLCTTLNQGDPATGSPVFSVARYDTATATWLTKACSNSLDGFELQAGEAYAAVLDRSITAPVTVTLVGSHDDRYSANKGGTRTIDLPYVSPGMENASLVAIPYHVLAADSEELCTLVNGDPTADVPLERLAVFDPATDTPQTKLCMNPLPTPTIAAGEGMFFTPGGSTSQQLQFDVY